MVKTIKASAYQHPYWGNQFRCSHCQSILEFEPGDEKILKQHYGQRDQLESETLPCPECGTACTIGPGHWYSDPSDHPYR